MEEKLKSEYKEDKLINKKNQTWVRITSINQESKVRN